MIKRLFDILLSALLGIILILPILIISIAVRCSSKGPSLYWSDRVGRNNELFKMPKFRSMYIDSPTLPTHLLKSPDTYLTPIGKFIRKTSLDELPQLWSILNGNMSFVGPRPALFNQDDLISMRTSLGVHLLTPGLTGWAQINGRDLLTIEKKVEFDLVYLQNQSLKFDLYILLKTLIPIINRHGVSH